MDSTAALEKRKFLLLRGFGTPLYSCVLYITMEYKIHFTITQSFLRCIFLVVFRLAVSEIFGVVMKSRTTGRPRRKGNDNNDVDVN